MPSFTWPERTSSTVIFTLSPIRMFSPNFLVRTSIVEPSSVPSLLGVPPGNVVIGQEAERLKRQDSPSRWLAPEQGPGGVTGTGPGLGARRLRSGPFRGARAGSDGRREPLAEGSHALEAPSPPLIRCRATLSRRFLQVLPEVLRGAPMTSRPIASLLSWLLVPAAALLVASALTLDRQPYTGIVSRDDLVAAVDPGSPGERAGLRA